MNKILKLLKILADSTYRRALLKHGVAAGVEHEAMINALHSLTVVDVGANRGQFSLVVRKCLPMAYILAFEPLDVPAEKFQALFAKDAKARLSRTALGTYSETKTIHVSRRDDSSSLLPITETQHAMFPGTFEVGTQQVEVAPLRHSLRPEEIRMPALLKMDVQGYELVVLQGCEDLLNRFSHVYVECSFIELYEGQAFANDVVAWLQVRGFLLSGVFNTSYDSAGQAIQADFLFRRNPGAVSAI